MASGAQSSVGKLFEYFPKLFAFDFVNQEVPQPNVIIFVGGLGDGLLTVPYVPKLAERVKNLTTKDGKWTVIQALISSSYIGWGTGSLERDAFEISQLVKHLRSEAGGSRKRIILMGHLTGSQDTMHYLANLHSNKDTTPDAFIDGGIMQAPASDREALVEEKGKSKIDSLVNKCYVDYISVGKKDFLLSENDIPDIRAITFGTPITAYRFHSITSVRGDDDFFSSYLTSEDHKKTFGKIDKPVLILFGEHDEYIPPSVDKEKLVNSWKHATNPKFWSSHSKIVPGASHNVGPTSKEGAVECLIDSVAAFILSL